MVRVGVLTLRAKATSRTLAIYALAVMLASSSLVFGEEPWLARRYGRQWEVTGRWCPDGSVCSKEACG
jgi:hypothetical protein